MEKVITTNKVDALADANIVTAYIGGKTGKYETVPILDADEPLVDVFWDEARAWAASGLGEALIEDMSEGGSVSFCVDMGEGKSVWSAERLLRSAMASYVMARWLEVCGHEATTLHEERAERMISSLKRQVVYPYPTVRRLPII